MRKNLWAEFEKENHLKPKLKRRKFEKLKLWDFGWFLLEPMNIIKNPEEDEIEVTKRFSKGQKMLHFFWYLDAQVTNGGFIQFYVNEFDKYIPAILEGLKIISDYELIELLNNTESLYESNKSRFDDPEVKTNEEKFGALYDDLSEFEELDDRYYEIHDKTMQLIENYARNNASEFGEIK